MSGQSATTFVLTRAKVGKTANSRGACVPRDTRVFNRLERRVLRSVELFGGLDDIAPTRVSTSLDLNAACLPVVEKPLSWAGP